jgi:hypothetical protein
MDLKKGASYFVLQGQAKVRDNTFSLENLSEAKGWRYNKMFLAVDCGKEAQNLVYSELMGGYSEKKANTLYVHGKKLNDSKKEIDDYDNRFEIDFNDRENPEILKTIGERCFIKISIERDIEGKPITRKFLSSYDAIKYMAENLKHDEDITIRGNLKYSRYEGRTQIKKEITSVYLTSEEAKEKGNYTEFRQLILLDTSSIWKADTENNVIPVIARVIDYDKSIKKNSVFEIKLEVPYDKTDKEDLEMKATMLMKTLKPQKNITEAEIIGEFQESAPTVDITEDQITDGVKYLMQIGRVSVQDLKEKVLKDNNKKLRRMILITPNCRMVEKPDGDFIFETCVTHDKYKEEDLIVNVPQESENTVMPDDKEAMIKELGIGIG